MTWRGEPIKPKRKLRVNDNKIRLMMIGDIHIPPSGGVTGVHTNYTRAIQAARQLRPNAVCLLGDYTYYAERGGFNWVFNYGKSCRTEFIAIIGNHDIEEDTYGRGNPDLATPAKYFGYPYYFANTIYSGDNTRSALILSLDQNYHGGAPTQYYATYDQFGVYAGIGDDSSTYGQYSFDPAQIAWIQKQLELSTADILIVLCHSRPDRTLNHQTVLDMLAADGRPVSLWYCHNHGNATLDIWRGINCYKPPALFESGCWVMATYSADGTLESAVINDYTPVDGWTIDEPFTLAV